MIVAALFNKNSDVSDRPLVAIEVIPFKEL